MENHTYAARKAEIIGTFMDTIRDMSDEKETIKELHKCYDKLNALPPADVVEVKHGKWVFEDGRPVNRTLNTGEIAICDQCGKTAPGYPFWECDLELTDFCPNCGADMRERRKEE